MKQKIEAQIENINNSLEWIKIHKEEEYEQKFLLLIEERRKLRSILRAELEKPAIAAFGESQKGKSYLIGNLLQKQKSPFTVIDENGLNINFVDRVNPIGDKKEATGVVTRFTPFNTEMSTSRYIDKHPVIVKLFSISSLATILCDSYFQDLIDSKFYADEDIQNIAENIYNKYNSRHICQDIFTEDDILDIKAYLSKHVNKVQNIIRSGYFEKLALVIRKVPIEEWSSVTKYLWHENLPITNLFERFITALKKLEFANEVYVDFDAVMHLGDNKNTIMSVDCLNGLDAENWSLTTNVYLRDNNNIKVVSGFPKCELCALCSETIFKIEPDFLKDQETYCFDINKDGQSGYMSTSSYNKTNKTVIKDLLLNTDLLDFPGARNRLSLQEEFLLKMDTKYGASNLVQMLLRGKVAYLFNSYNESKAINILLFCHDNEQPAVNAMYSMINDWVIKYVGESIEARRETIKSCDNVAPLFVVGTKFNIDMIEKHKEDGDSDAALNGRWTGRFIKVLYTQSFQAESVDWFNNWDGVGSTFKNTYLLRDYKYSGCNGVGNNLYMGYDETEKNPSEKALHLSPDFYARLRNTFVTNPDVAKFFDDPELSWDVATTINNDGALYIIEKLSKVASKMSATRRMQFEKNYKSSVQKVYNLLSSYYVSTDIDKILEVNIRKAKSIFREMDFTCNNDNYYFGHLIQALQITESDSYRAIHKIIQSPEINGMVNDFRNYEIIRNSCENAGHPIENCNTESEKMNCVIETYGFLSAEEAEDYFRKKGIDKQKLFGGLYRRRLNSCIIADSVYAKWCTAIKSVDFFNEFSQEDGFDVTIMNNLVDELILTAEALGVRDIMAASIAEYVDIIDLHAANESLIADMLADTINDFVNDFGFSLLSDEDKLKAKGLCEKRNLPAFKYIEKELPAEMDEVALTNLFNEMSANPKALLPSFEDNYNKWLEYMFISFVAHLDIPDFDHEANVALESLLEKIKVA